LAGGDDRCFWLDPPSLDGHRRFPRMKHGGSLRTCPDTYFPRRPQDRREIRGRQALKVSPPIRARFRSCSQSSERAFGPQAGASLDPSSPRSARHSGLLQWRLDSCRTSSAAKKTWSPRTLPSAAAHRRLPPGEAPRLAAVGTSPAERLPPSASASRLTPGNEGWYVEVPELK